ncbi:MAG: hypothetical protein K8F62_13945 [Pseudorhodoplanes sp.]|nr:hypothetical protein [Pseudorhodoplanes sp.]
MLTKIEQLEAVSPGACGLLPVMELLSILELRAPSFGALTANDMANVSGELAKFGFGVEPDPRSAAPLPGMNSKVVIFRELAGAASARLDFLTARTEVEIAALVAAHDGQIDAREAKEIVEKIKAMSRLSNSDKVRLIAFLAYLVANPPGQTAVKKITESKVADRKIVADAAFRTAAMKGELRDTDVRFLERTFDKLNLPKQALQEKIDTLKANLTPTPDLPPLVKKGEPGRSIQIPPEQKIEPNIGLCNQRISEIRADTEKVNEILCGIFEAEDGIQIQETNVSPVLEAADAEAIHVHQDHRFPGLDLRHAGLLNEIWESSEIDPNQFAALARKHGLMPAGAVETINDWSFERFEEPLLDEGPLIAIARHLIPDARVDGHG